MAGHSSLLTPIPIPHSPIPHSPVGLFIPCYIDQLYPQVGLATVDLLERFGVEIDFPEAQTCCGQPMANTGCTSATEPLAHRFVEIFARYEHIVAPSGSRVHDHVQAGAEVITAGDMSCLMHLEGLIRRDRQPLRVMHSAELLVEATQSRTDFQSVQQALGVKSASRPNAAHHYH